MSNPTNCKQYEIEGRGRFPEPQWNQRGGDRVCSYCGCLHPDDVREILKSIDNVIDVIDGTSKSYKFYIRRKSVPTAAEGGTKFYTWHLDADNREDTELLKDLKEAVRVGLAKRQEGNNCKGATE